MVRVEERKVYFEVEPYIDGCDIDYYRGTIEFVFQTVVMYFIEGSQENGMLKMSRTLLYALDCTSQEFIRVGLKRFLTVNNKIDCHQSDPFLSSSQI